MSNWLEVIGEIREEADKGPMARVRHKYLDKVFQVTGRNVIAYYSGWLHVDDDWSNTDVNDKDMDAFMLAIHGLDRTKGLDLILHTPGGDIAATEAIVTYLKSMFGNEIRAIVPQLAMSAGTMIAMSCKEIIMGKHSSLGPVDPQFGSVPAQEIIAEWDTAINESLSNPEKLPFWQLIINKYSPTFLARCKHAITWSRGLTEKWLKDNMLSSNPDKVDEVLEVFAKHSNQKSHSRHIMVDTCKDAGLVIQSLEDNADLQDAILTLHHAFMHTFSRSDGKKIVENHLGVTYSE